MSGRADTPTPEFVGNSRVRGARSPGRTPGNPTTPSPGTDFTRAKRRSRAQDFRRAKRRSVPPGLSQSKAKKRRRTFAEQSGEVPGGLSQSKVKKRQADFHTTKWRSAARTFAQQSEAVCPAPRALSARRAGFLRCFLYIRVRAVFRDESLNFVTKKSQFRFFFVAV